MWLASLPKTDQELGKSMNILMEGYRQWNRTATIMTDEMIADLGLEGFRQRLATAVPTTTSPQLTITFDTTPVGDSLEAAYVQWYEEKNLDKRNQLNEMTNDLLTLRRLGLRSEAGLEGIRDLDNNIMILEDELNSKNRILTQYHRDLRCVDNMILNIHTLQGSPDGEMKRAGLKQVLESVQVSFDTTGKPRNGFKVTKIIVKPKPPLPDMTFEGSNIEEISHGLDKRHTHSGRKKSSP